MPVDRRDRRPLSRQRNVESERANGTGSLCGGRVFLAIQAEPPAVNLFDIPFFAATVTARNFRVPHLCPLIVIITRLCRRLILTLH
jgi:hypothetical protein